MPQLNKSEAVHQRLRCLLQRLIAFANHALPECEQLEDKISVRWMATQSDAPKLIVKTEIRFLAALAFPNSGPKAKANLKQDLRTLKDFLGRLEDNRDRTQGSGLWHFTLTLWHTSVEKNLAAFDNAWQQRKAAIPKAIAQPVPLQLASLEEASLEEASSAPNISLSTHHNLPARDYGTFVGRERPLQQLLHFLEADHPAARISITGMGGIGKTALVLEAAYRCLRIVQASAGDRHPAPFKAVIFASTKTQHFTPQGILPSYRYSRTLQDLLRSIAQTLKSPALLAGDFENQLENTYSLLSRQRTLLIVDNLEALDTQQQQAILAFLYDLPAGVKGIVTSRLHVTMDAVIPLSGLAPAEGIQLVRHQASSKAVALSETTCQRLYQQTGGTPAAIVYALGQLAAGYAVTQVLPKLSLETSDYCRYYLKGAVESLRGRPAHSLLMALSLFPASASSAALSDIAQLTEETAAEGLATLQQRSLLTGHSGRYSMLPLTQDYLLTEQQIHANFEAANFEAAIRDRWVSWHQQQLLPHSHQNWRDWHDYTAIDAEWETIQAVVEWCIAQNRREDFAQLWQGLKGYTHLRGYWNERLSWLEWWLAASLPHSDQPQQDPLIVIQALRDLGWTLTMMGTSQQLDQAALYFSQAWDYRHQVDLAYQLEIAIEHAVLLLFQDRLEQVSPWLQTANTLLAQLEPTSAKYNQQQLRLKYYTAQLHYRLGHYAQAGELYRNILAQAQITQQQQTEVYVLNWLVDIALQENNLEEAEHLLDQSWSIIHSRRDRRSQAFHRRSKAQLEKLRGNLSGFQHWSQQAKACFEELGMQTQVQEMQAWLAETSTETSSLEVSVSVSQGVN
ncbi:MAG: AAA family ATPase [Phormidesmis sp.]